MPSKTWKFPAPLVPATIDRRYKRFFADARLGDGTPVTAHCPNTGSMKSCWEPGGRIWLLQNDDPKRKLKYTWELTETDGGFIGVNTARPNRVVEHAIENGGIRELRGYARVRREVKYGSQNSRIDLLLEPEEGVPAYVEIKNTTLLDGKRVVFPDAVTSRGRKHLEELKEMARAGYRAVMFFFVNRPEGNHFAPADAIDPEYGRALRSALKAGVELLAYRVETTTEGMDLKRKVPIRLS